MGLIESKVQIARFRARAEREEEEVAVEGPLSQEDEGECGDHGSSTSNSSEAGGEAASSSEDERPITPLSSETASSDYEPPVDIAAPAIAAAEETENRSVPICGELFFAFITVERVATKQKEDANKSGDDDRYDLDEEEMERRQRCAADVGDEGEGESDDESVTTQRNNDCCGDSGDDRHNNDHYTHDHDTHHRDTHYRDTHNHDTTVTTGVRRQTRNIEEGPRNGEQHLLRKRRRLTK
ncbi:hypothetical protein RB195_009731 [Necator americanus]|uniref:Uncharacterized protein n=1 Tax=Necator americanus TaxID=51031 RepID=A0ABR1CV77_NECAM